MRHRFAAVALLAALGATATAASAQEVPEGQSCGGLLCDMGMFGHKTSPKVEAAPAAAVASPTPAPVAMERAARPKRALADAKKGEGKTAARRGKRVAKAVAAPEPAVIPGAAPVLAPSLGAAPAATRAATTTAVEASPPTAATAAEPIVMLTPYASPPPAAALPAPVPARAASEPIVLANPYASPTPLAPVFQTVMPALPGLQ